ncbi:TPA: radical SAM protein [archaeon]|uniref:Radical SAM protein n=1 Tax=Candidatus Naiadarchaeum limnaeum TaxID=2756139 RepID=A0A832V1A2_9ARCH|nr:radical SAM protein [Candidatus Naiadarchaeum limnaeum]
MTETKKIRKVLLTQPNYSWSEKRTWKMYPYSLAVLNACIKDSFKTELFDPNFDNLSDEEILDSLRKSNADAVTLGTNSTEYVKTIEHMTSLIKTALPNAIVIEGGVLPTVAIGTAMKDKNVNYWVMGEGELAFPKLLNELNNSRHNLSEIKGLAYYENGKAMISRQEGHIEDLNSMPFADYGNLNIMDYGNQQLKYAQGLCARRLPYALTVTSRGCSYRCTFCSVPVISGSEVRVRSAENVLKEIDVMYKQGIKEVIFLDDHFLSNRKRVIDIMKGLIERKYDLTWKCVNLIVWLLDEELLDLMKKSGCYQITVSIESGNQDVLNKIIKKPVNLARVPGILSIARKKGLEIIANFIIGFPGETWEQIRDTFAYAEKLDVDLVNFHIATPLPNTDFAKRCIEEGYLPEDFNEKVASVGYTHGAISTDEFLAEELQILRAFEWDRINFRSKERKEAIARIQGISMEELENWRKETRHKLGVNVVK